MAAVGEISVWVINVCVVLLLNLFYTASGDALGVKFGYTGSVGPNIWGSLSPTYSACSNGKSQSPINIITRNCAVNKKLKPLIMQYNHSEVATLVDNGFNVGIKYGDNAGSLIVDGKTYNFKQMHWHSPSEHTIDGSRYAAELHLVHFAEDNAIAVLSILFHLGHPDPLMTKLQNKLNELVRDVATQKVTQVQLGTIDTHEIRKHSHKYYTYTGSLTTPPCSEIVTWYILGKQSAGTRRQGRGNRRPPVGSGTAHRSCFVYNLQALLLIMDALNELSYKPPPEFEEHPGLDGQEVSLKLHHDGHMGSFEDLSGDSTYLVVFCFWGRF